MYVYCRMIRRANEDREGGNEWPSMRRAARTTDMLMSTLAQTLGLQIFNKRATRLAATAVLMNFKVKPKLPNLATKQINVPSWYANISISYSGSLNGDHAGVGSLVL